MVADLSLPVEIVIVPTVREEDGLAKSSRNQYLSEDERATAPVLYAVLEEVGKEIRDGRTDFEALESKALAKLAEAGFEAEYVSIRNASDLSEPDRESGELVVLGSAWLGKARLIDNLLVEI